MQDHYDFRVNWNNCYNQWFSNANPDFLNNGMTGIESQILSSHEMDDIFVWWEDYDDTIP